MMITLWAHKSPVISRAIVQQSNSSAPPVMVLDCLAGKVALPQEGPDQHAARTRQRLYVYQHERAYITIASITQTRIPAQEGRAAT
jgi:murein endopeptidase